MRYGLLHLIGLFVIILMTVGCTVRPGMGYEIVYSLESQNQPAVTEKEQDNGKSTIAVVAKSASPYYAYAEEGAREAARELGVDIIFESPKLLNAEQQIEMVEALIKKDVDVIAISAIDAEKLIPILVKAQSQGIRVITWDSDTLLKGREFSVNQVETEVLGRHLMDNMAQVMGDKGRFVVLTESQAAIDAEANELIKWIQIQRDNYYPDMALIEITTDITGLLEKRSDINGILDLSSIDEVAAVEAVKMAGRADEVKVTGLYSPSVIREYLHGGAVQIATLWSPRRLGYLTVTLANYLLKGIYPTDGLYIPSVGSIRMLGNTVIMDEPIDFTRENVDQYDF